MRFCDDGAVCAWVGHLDGEDEGGRGEGLARYDGAGGEALLVQRIWDRGVGEEGVVSCK